MHFVYICQDKGIPIDGAKGSSIHVRSMVRALASSDVSITLLSPRIGKTAWADDLPITFKSVSKDDQDSVRKALEEIHATTPIDGVYERLSLWADVGSRWCRDYHIPHMVEVNAPLVDEAVEHRGLDNAEMAREIEKAVLYNANLIFIVSPWLKRWIWQSGIDVQKLVVLPNAVPADWIIGEIKPLHASGRKIRLGFVGSLRPWHDLKTVLDAMAILPKDHYELQIIGDGPMLSEIETQLDQLGLGTNVVMVGKIEHSKMVEAIDLFDICLAPYAENDFFYFCPIKIFEYGARGKPVVAPQVDGLLEQFPHGCLARYAPENAGSLAEIIQGLAKYPNLANSHAKQLHQFVRQHTWEKHAKFVFQQFGELQAGRT